MKTDTTKISDLFRVKSGTYHDTASLDPGKIPLISCGNQQQGLVGFYDIPKEHLHTNSITVAYNGAPLTVKYHPYVFAAKDDVGILVPKIQMQATEILYIASLISMMKWRYSYGRKCFRGKMENMRIPYNPHNKAEFNSRLSVKYKATISDLMPNIMRLVESL